MPSDTLPVSGYGIGSGLGAAGVVHTLTAMPTQLWPESFVTTSIPTAVTLPTARTVARFVAGLHRSSDRASRPRETLYLPAAVEGLSLELFAWISAHLDAGVPKDQVLARAGVGTETWQAEQRTWLDLFKQRAERGKSELWLHYSRTYMQYRSEADRVAASLKPSRPK